MRLLNVLLLITSLMGYLEWGTDQHSFLFQAEYQILAGPWEAGNFQHPLVLLPMVGQVLLLVTVFQKTPGKWITLIGMGCIGLLLMMVLLAGALSLNVRMLASVLPFFITAAFVARKALKKLTNAN